MTDKSIIIIGAGIAGLSTGCYAQMNGYRTHIFELHDKPGGLCTAWKRKGYTFDGCIHHLAGSGPNSGIHHIWQELGAVQGREMIYRDTLVQVEGPDGEVFTVYTDPDRLERHMKELAPADGSAIEEYVRGVRRFTGLELLALPALKPLGILAALPFLPSLIKWSQVTLGEFATRFTDPFLRRAFPWIQYDLPDIPAMLNMSFLASCHTRRLGWPVGGSLAFSQAIEQRYRDLGGEIQYRSRVEKILVSDDRATGVRLEDGTEHRADVVISAADGHATIFRMLDGRYLNDKIRSYYDAAPTGPQEMSAHVCLGVARDMAQEPHALTLLLAEPLAIVGETFERLDVDLFGPDTGLAPAGKTALKIPLTAGYAYWRERYDDRARYKEEKQRVAGAVIEQLDQRFPGLKDQVEVVDVSTPVTVERYTGNWRGMQAWPGGGPMDMLSGVSKTLPGLENFHMVGQWALGTIGISTAAIAGRKLVENLCRRDGRRFVTTVGPTR